MQTASVAFPLQFEISESFWSQEYSYDEIFTECIDGMLDDTAPDSASTGGHEAFTPDFFPDIATPPNKQVELVTTLDNGIPTADTQQVTSQTDQFRMPNHQSSEGHVSNLSTTPALRITPRTPSKMHNYDTYSFPSPPPVPPAYDEPRGRTQAGASRGSIKRSRNPSGIRKPLRYAKSTPNMVGSFKLRGGINDLFGDAFETPPPMPLMAPLSVVPGSGSLWNPGHVPLPSPNQVEGASSAPFMGFADLSISEKVIQHQPTHAFDFGLPQMTPLDPIQAQSVTGDLGSGAGGLNVTLVQSIGGNASRFFDNGNGLNMTTTDFATLLAPSEAWDRPHSDRPETLSLNAAAMQAIPPRAVMSALPFASPAFSFDGAFSTTPIDPCISPKTTQYPLLTTNFSHHYTTHSNKPQTPLPRTRPRRSASTTPPPVPAIPPTPTQARSTSRLRHHRRTRSGPAPTGCSNTSRSSRSRSRNGSPQKQPGGAFVNFTPDDAPKLLAGVAPSGSSKTKAKRDREVIDAKRRFNAALRAVKEGNLEALKEVVRRGVNL
ncbi:hypothetical protein K461DRAFT_303298 [Myriangium duriaei CBS 260.36]|uniref:Developmental regulatory protein wetA n=1 Tax=Myriangium duriaei CBS 260.36 TaxID=1168546 RepID=A0A9P4MN38_9PEZI|nr:hypothetical protein K461DRAFT_303298 [Myriangium duriaei CBS 260.36]